MERRAVRWARRSFRFHLWYGGLLFLWMMTFGGWLFFFYVGSNASPSANVSFAQVFVSFADELWPPDDIFGLILFAAFWIPFVAAPFGLTEPTYSELY